MQTDFDVIVVGAGLVGSSVLQALRDSDCRVCVLEKRLPDVNKVDELSSRPISLAYASSLILQNHKLWDELKSSAGEISAVHTSVQRQFGRTLISAAQQKVPALGYVLPYKVLQAELWRAALSAKFSWQQVDAISVIDNQTDQVSVTVERAGKQSTISARYLIAADGAESRVRELLGIDTDRQDYQQMAMTGTITLSQSHKGVAYERFFDGDTLALLPLQDEYKMGFVWTLSNQHFQRYQDYDEAQLLKLLQSTIGYRLGYWQTLQRGATYPVQTIIAKQQVQNSTVLLGNAAHTIYPLAAQGFNLGLRDAQCFTELLLHAKQDASVWQSGCWLHDYVAARTQDQQKIIGITSAIESAFSKRLPVWNSLKGIGLLGLDVCTPLKNTLARRLLGVAGLSRSRARGVHE